MPVDSSGPFPRNVSSNLEANVLNQSNRQADHSGSLWSRLRRSSLRVLGVALVGYVGILALLVYNEPRLVYPGANPRDGEYSVRPSNTEEVWIDSFDGTRLHAWLLKSPDPTRTILFCHGNAENVAGVGHHFGRRLRDELQADVLVVDYRGFGLTDGQPNEAAVVGDCAAALKWLSQRTGVEPDAITLFGRSLGGGIAVQLASQFGARELIIDRTFDSLVSPAARKFPWIPVSLLMRNRYPSDQLIGNCKMPVFQTHFAADELIPIDCAKALFARVANPDSEFHEIPGGSHLEPLPSSYWPVLREFLQRVNRP